MYIIMGHHHSHSPVAFCLAIGLFYAFLFLSQNNN